MSFSWNMTQARIDLLAELLWKLQTMANVVEAKNGTADQTADLLSDLRTQCCAAGADDPMPHLPLFICVEFVSPTPTTDNQA